MIFFHLLIDIYDLSWTNTNSGITSAPMFNIILLVLGIYMGSWAGLFLMISATSNMISMHNNFESGKSVGSVVIKQVFGGFVLLIFGFLAEGTLQYYAVFQTAFRFGMVDWTRILWKGYTMETIHTIAWCMIVNGIIQGLLSRNGGHLKIRRNIFIYAVLAIIVIIATQPIWTGFYTALNGYPFATVSYSINGTAIVAERPILTDPLDYILKFFLLPLAGVPEPIFPFLAVSFIGSIIGCLLCEEPVSRTWPKKGVLIGVLIFVGGILFWVIMDYPFSYLLPLSGSSFSDFRGLGMNYDTGVQFYGWVPWVAMITGGQLVVVCILFRLVEFRGKSAKFADKTKIIRRFGMVPFTLYTFHRIIAIVPMGIISLIFGVDVMVDTATPVNGWAALAVIGICLLFIHVLLLLWEKKDYIGSLEWMMGEIEAYALRRPKKSAEKQPWYRWGARDQKGLFYNVDWIDIYAVEDNGGDQYRDSKLAFKFSLAGLLTFIGLPISILALRMSKSATAVEGDNKFAQRAKKIGLIALVVNIVLIVVMYVLTLSTLGIHSL